MQPSKKKDKMLKYERVTNEKNISQEKVNNSMSQDKFITLHFSLLFTIFDSGL